MATHQVDLTIPHNISISNVDHSLRVKRNGTLLGVLTISKGAIDWKRAHARGASPCLGRHLPTSLRIKNGRQID